MKTIQFTSVGRNKLSWQAQMEEANEASIVRAIQNKGALLSRDVFVEDGKIFAGCRLAGAYFVLGDEISLSA